jgi:hypothetical protein
MKLISFFLFSFLFSLKVSADFEFLELSTEECRAYVTIVEKHRVLCSKVQAYDDRTSELLSSHRLSSEEQEKDDLRVRSRGSIKNVLFSPKLFQELWRACAELVSYISAVSLSIKMQQPIEWHKEKILSAHDIRQKFLRERTFLSSQHDKRASLRAYEELIEMEKSILQLRINFPWFRMIKFLSQAVKETMPLRQVPFCAKDTKIEDECQKRITFLQFQYEVLKSQKAEDVFQNVRTQTIKCLERLALLIEADEKVIVTFLLKYLMKLKFEARLPINTIMERLKNHFKSELHNCQQQIISEQGEALTPHAPLQERRFEDFLPDSKGLRHEGFSLSLEANSQEIRNPSYLFKLPLPRPQQVIGRKRTVSLSLESGHADESQGKSFLYSEAFAQETSASSKSLIDISPTVYRATEAIQSPSENERTPQSQQPRKKLALSIFIPKKV